MFPTVLAVAGAIVLIGGTVGHRAEAAPSRAQSTAQAAADTSRVTTENEAAGYRVKQPQSFAPFVPPTLGPIDVNRFSFTAPGRSAGQRSQVVDRGFSFTPSGATERGRRGVSVDVNTRSLGTAQTPVRASGVAALADNAATTPGAAPSGHNFDVSLGYRGFSLSGGLARMDSGAMGGHVDGADLGLSYAARNWTTGVRASVERGSMLPIPNSRLDERIGVEAGGALALSPSLSVGGTVRYRMAPDHPTPLDPNKDERAVLVGGALAF